MDKLTYFMHTMEYYSITKRNEGLIHAVTCIHLENILLSERNQLQKTIYYVILYRFAYTIYRDRKEIHGCSGLSRNGGVEGGN